MSLKKAKQDVVNVERAMPGWMVIAGPFAVEAVQAARRRDEQRLCANAKAEQDAAGVLARVVMYRQQAYVVRTQEGWREQSKTGEVRVRTLGYFCPLCSLPLTNVVALRVHCCPRKGKRAQINGKFRFERLTQDEIELAVARRESMKQEHAVKPEQAGSLSHVGEEVAA